MRRRRKKNRGLRWTIALIVVGVLGYVGVQYWKGRHPIEPTAPSTAAPTTTVVQPVPLPPPSPVTVAKAATPTATFMSEAESRDAAARAVREQTLAVQQKLREANRDRTQAADKPAQDERCINGQRMKRIGNGWVQASGDCPGAVAPAEAPAPMQQQGQETQESSQQGQSLQEQSQQEQPQQEQPQPESTEEHKRSDDHG